MALGPHPPFRNHTGSGPETRRSPSALIEQLAELESPVMRLCLAAGSRALAFA
jgi:hypothetical protein